MARPSFRDGAELRGVFDAFFDDLSTDPRLGPGFREVGVSQRFVITDLGETLDLDGTPDEDAAAGRFLRWAWGGTGGASPDVTFELKGEVANAFFQGKVNALLAAATGKIRTHGDLGKAARLGPLVRQAYPRYRAALAAQGLDRLLL